MSRIVVFPDLHFPFADNSKVSEGIELAKDFKPDLIIQVGDLYDQLSFSKYPRDPSESQLTPKQELTLARTQATDFWRRLGGLRWNPRRCQLTDANHDVRIVKRINEKAPEASFIVKDWLDSMFTFQGVEKVESEFTFEGIMFLHGYKMAGTHAPYNQMNTVTGHTHTAGIKYFSNIHGNYWEANAGWLGDKSATAPFGYRNQKRIDNTQQGILLIEDGNPMFWSL